MQIRYRELLKLITMKYIFKLLVFILFCMNTYGQKNNNDFFTYNKKEVYYSTYNFKNVSNKFNIIIIQNKNIEFEKEIKLCIKKKKKLGNIYYIFIPEEFSEQKEELVLEFMSDILSKRKLIDKEMNVFADGNYFNLYEETRTSNNGKYKNSFLNKIHKTTILNSSDNICGFLN